MPQIRISVNYDMLEGKVYDPLSCRSIGQKIKLDNNEIHICENKDILTEKQLLAIKGTMENAIRFLRNTIKVQSRLDPIKIVHDNIQQVYSDTDLIIVCTYQYVGCLADETSIANDYYSRTVLARICFNPLYVPDEAVDESDDKNSFFTQFYMNLFILLDFMWMISINIIHKEAQFHIRILFVI